MVAHDNVHIPTESWPNWTWYALEFGIVLAISLVIGWKVIKSFKYLKLLLRCALESWIGLSIHSPRIKR